jgi:hypothetical protein
MNQVNKEILKRAAKGIGIFLLISVGVGIVCGIVVGTGWCICKMDANCYWRNDAAGVCMLALVIYVGISLVIAASMDWYTIIKKEVEADLLKSSKEKK